MKPRNNLNIFKIELSIVSNNTCSENNFQILKNKGFFKYHTITKIIRFCLNIYDLTRNLIKINDAYVFCRFLDFCNKNV